MSIRLNPYLNFPGNTREAMTYYQGVFGGELTISTYGEYGMEPPEATMHASLAHPDFTVMASDAMPGAEQTWGGTRVYLAFTGDDLETLTGWFTALAAEGTVGMPLEKQVWGDVYGILTDKYGLEWMFDVAAGE
ncbi:VOC family protein [Propionicicella superfundia]|uniref:VOC family protein n=1 Tax=Propionicicella superfundia TaxID=348582 RepID=UPI00041D29DB|nr:VOC family protein [Propionicicella superfundia]